MEALKPGDRVCFVCVDGTQYDDRGVFLGYSVLWDDGYEDQCRPSGDLSYALHGGSTVAPFSLIEEHGQRTAATA